MQLGRNVVATLFEINAPIWNGNVGARVVGLAKHRLTKHNEIHFMYRRKSDGRLSIPDVFYFDGDKAGQYSTQVVKGTTLVLVPFSQLERLERVSPPEPAKFKKEYATEFPAADPQVSMFDDIEEVEAAETTRRRMNAVRWLCNKGYTPMIGGLKNLRNFKLVNKDTKEIETFDINTVLAEYDQERKDEARARAAERRIQQKGAQHGSSY